MDWNNQIPHFAFTGVVFSGPSLEFFLLDPVLESSSLDPLWSLLYSTLFWSLLYWTLSGIVFTRPSTGVFFIWPFVEFLFLDPLLESKVWVMLTQSESRLISESSLSGQNSSLCKLNRTRLPSDEAAVTRKKIECQKV